MQQWILRQAVFKHGGAEVGRSFIDCKFTTGGEAANKTVLILKYPVSSTRTPISIPHPFLSHTLVNINACRVCSVWNCICMIDVLRLFIAQGCGVASLAEGVAAPPMHVSAYSSRRAPWDLERPPTNAGKWDAQSNTHRITLPAKHRDDGL